MSNQIALNDSETLSATLGCLSQHIKIPTNGKCDEDCLLKILIKAASRGDTIENTINSLKSAPASNTVRYHQG